MSAKSKLLIMSVFVFILFSLSSSSVFAQTTPLPTFGPTCSPSPAPPVATPTPVVPITAGAAFLTPLVLAIGGALFLGSFGVYFLLPNDQDKQ